MGKGISPSILALLQELPDTDYGVWTWEPLSGAMVFSENCARFLGYAPEAFPTTRSEWEKLLHPEDVPICEENKRILTSKAYGESFEFKIRLRGADGEYVAVYSKGYVVFRNQSQQALQLFGFYIPLTLFDTLMDGLLIQHERMSFCARCRP